MSDETTRMYTNGEVVVVWEASKCQHSGLCVRGLPRVFDKKQKPWVQLQNAASDEIVAQVRQCPSGALSLEDLTADGVDGQDDKTPPDGNATPEE
jgi:uncharacterized Fe-S cluster protein YjdI